MLVPHVRHKAGGPQAQLEPDEKHHGKERAAQLVVVPHLPHQLGIADHVSVVPHQLEHQAQCDHNEHRLWVLFLKPFFRLWCEVTVRAKAPFLAASSSSSSCCWCLFWSWMRQGRIFVVLVPRRTARDDPIAVTPPATATAPASIMASTESALLSCMIKLLFFCVFWLPIAVFCCKLSLGWIAMHHGHACRHVGM